MVYVEDEIKRILFDMPQESIDSISSGGPEGMIPKLEHFSQRGTQTCTAAVLSKYPDIRRGVKENFLLRAYEINIQKNWQNIRELRARGNHLGIFTIALRIMQLENRRLELKVNSLSAQN